MSVEDLIQYGSIAGALLLLLIKHKGMKKYVPVALFASLYANTWCYIAMYFNFWEFPSRLFSVVDDISVTVNMIVVPVLAMFWVRYCPLRLKEILWWAFIWTTVLTAGEFLVERYTGLVAYHNGYKWYFSYILWYFSWFIWLGFHLWLNNGRRELDSFIT